MYKVLLSSVLASSLVVAAGCGTTGASKQTEGAVLGGVLGGLAGSQIGSGSGRTAAIIGGSIAGIVIGSSIGRQLDENDRRMAEASYQRSLEHNRTGQMSHWNNPDSGNSGYVMPTDTYYDHSRSQPCRKYRHVVMIDGQEEVLYGTACRGENGKWQEAS